MLQAEKCIASGPGKDMFESTYIIADNQYKKAKVRHTPTSLFNLITLKIENRFVAILLSYEMS